MNTSTLTMSMSMSMSMSMAIATGLALLLAGCSSSPDPAVSDSPDAVVAESPEPSPSETVALADDVNDYLLTMRGLDSWVQGDCDTNWCFIAGMEDAGSGWVLVQTQADAMDDAAADRLALSMMNLAGIEFDSLEGIEVSNGPTGSNGRVTRADSPFLD